MKLNDFNNLTNFGIEDPRMTTIGGVAFRHLDRLPKPGDKVTVEGIMITILEMDEHRIVKVRVSSGSVEEEKTLDKESGQYPDNKPAKNDTTDECKDQQTDVSENGTVLNQKSSSEQGI